MSPIDRELEKALARRAEKVTPPADLYEGVTRRAARIRRQRAGAVAGAALTVLAVAVAVPLLTRGDERAGGFVNPGVSESPAPAVTTTTAPPSPAATTPPPVVADETVYVYYAKDVGRRGFKLYREAHKVPDGTIEAAVADMLGRPADPDYRTLWPSGTSVNGVTKEGDLATVDLNSAARRTTVGSEAAETAIQQLVYTVTATDNSVERVKLLIDGQEPGDLWGTIDTSRPFVRGDKNELFGKVWVITPESGATIGRTFTLTGSANVYEANVNWRVEITATGQKVADGYAMTGGQGSHSEYSKEITIPASVPDGTQLTVVAFEPEAEAGPEQEPDTKVVTLRG